MTPRILLIAAASAAVALAADPTAAMRASVSRLEQQATKSPSPIAVALELRAADALAPSRHDLAVELARHSLGTLNSSADKSLGAAARKQLEAILPGEGASIPPPPTAAAASQRTPAPPAVAAIQSAMRNLRGDLSDTERTKLDIDLANQIRALPAGAAKLSAARSLASLSTEGDLGAEALGAVAAALSTAMRENQSAASDSDYIELASLVRYEQRPSSARQPNPRHHAGVPGTARAGDAGSRVQSCAPGWKDVLSGRPEGQSRDGELLGHVVPSVPQGDAGHGKAPPALPEARPRDPGYFGRGHDTVTKFLADKGYTYPILLDPGRKANVAFGVEGIPQTFIFDREGMLAAQSIDMRTEAQFLKLLKQAGIE